MGSSPNSGSAARCLPATARYTAPVREWTGWHEFPSLPGVDWRVKAASSVVGEYDIQVFNGYGTTVNFNIRVSSSWPASTSDRFSLSPGEYGSTWFLLGSRYSAVYVRIDRVRFGTSDTGAYWSPASLHAGTSLLSEDFESGIDEGVWLAMGPEARVDEMRGAPVPSAVLRSSEDEGPSSLTTRSAFPLEPGLWVGVDVAAESGVGARGTVSLRDALDGTEAASVQLTVEGEGDAWATYRFGDRGPELRESLGPISPGTMARFTFVIFGDGRAAWFLGDQIRATAETPAPARQVLLSLEAHRGRVWFDSVVVTAPE